LLEMKLASSKVDAERVSAEAAAVQAEKEFSERQSKDNKEFQGKQRDLESKEHSECAKALQALTQQQLKTEQYWQSKIDQGKQSVAIDSKGIVSSQEQLRTKLASLEVEISDSKDRLLRGDDDVEEACLEEMRAKVRDLTTKMTESINLNNKLLIFFEELQL